MATTRRKMKRTPLPEDHSHHNVLMSIVGLQEKLSDWINPDNLATTSQHRNACRRMTKRLAEYRMSEDSPPRVVNDIEVISLADWDELALSANLDGAGGVFCDDHEHFRKQPTEQ